MAKLYVLVRKDLSKSQQAVQAGHAVAEYLLRGRSLLWHNGTLIYLVVHDEAKLKYWGDIFSNSGIMWVGFKEPNKNNELTAIATLLDKNQQNIVSNLKLL